MLVTGSAAARQSRIRNLHAYQAAKTLMRSFGELAASVAIARAMGAFEAGDRSGYAKWRNVLEEIRLWAV